MKAAAGLALSAALLAGCSWHEVRLSPALRPAVEDVGVPLTLFRARVQMGVLEVWARAKHADGDYVASFDLEKDNLGALCAALANSDLTYREEWRELALQLTHEYGSSWRWKNTYSVTRVRIDYEGLRALRGNPAAAAECLRQGNSVWVKVGPPDFVPSEWHQVPP
jgi:hypothetical protein